MNSTQKINILKQFHTRLLKERFINNQASVYYSSQNSKFVIPGILITGVSSIISFMATSDLLNTGTKSAFSIGVGIFTAGATILQSISSSFGFQSRAEDFQKAADSYDTLITKIEFEINNPNEDFNDFCNNLETAILDIKNNCKYLPPLFVHKLWDQFKSSEEFESNSIDINSYHNNLNTPQTQNQTQQQNQDTLINIEDATTNNN
jgi:hypothetical protein